MQLEQHDAPISSLARPQLHSRKCHHTYNATRCLPRAVWVRSLRINYINYPSLVRDKHRQPLHSHDGGSGEGGDGGACTLAYEILLYYQHNRACTIYRTPQDVRRLRSGLGRLSSSSSSSSSSPLRDALGGGGGGSPGECVMVEDVEALQLYLCEAIGKRGRDCALEYFLRRRMEDCDGGGV